MSAGNKCKDFLRSFQHRLITIVYLSHSSTVVNNTKTPLIQQTTERGYHKVYNESINNAVIKRSESKKMLLYFRLYYKYFSKVEKQKGKLVSDWSVEEFFLFNSKWMNLALHQEG